MRDALDGFWWGSLIALAIAPWILLATPQSTTCQPNPANGPLRVLSKAAR